MPMITATTLLRFRYVLGGQGALDDVLVEAPVGDVHDPHAADQHGEARQVAVELARLVEDHLEVVGVAVHQGGEAAHEARGAADLTQRDGQDDDAAQDQQGHLNDVRQGHGLQAARYLIGQGEDAEDDQHGHRIEAGDGRYRRAAQPQDRGQVDEDVEQQPEDGHQELHAGAKALLQEARHGGHAIAQKDRDEELADDKQGDRRHPLIGGDG